MAILRNRVMRCELFEPDIKVMVKAGFVIVDEHGGRYVHGVAEQQTILYSALLDTFFDLRSDVDKSPAVRNVEP